MAADPLANLVEELSKLPGIGPKTARRLAHHLLRANRSRAEALARAVIDVKDRMVHCSTCHQITAVDPCTICSDPQRDQTRICVVEQPFNVEPMEGTGEFRGLYHVLLGHISPQKGVGPDDLTVASLLKRLDGVEEAILAMNPNVEGEATALYLASLLTNRGVRVSRLAFGLPVGGDIDYADPVTLAHSLTGRRELV